MSRKHATRFKHSEPLLESSLPDLVLPEPGIEVGPKATDDSSSEKCGTQVRKSLKTSPPPPAHDSDDSDDTWPWIDEASRTLKEFLDLDTETHAGGKNGTPKNGASSNTVPEFETRHAPAHGHDDHSQTQDVILCEPPDAYAEMLSLKHTSAKNCEAHSDEMVAEQSPCIVVQDVDEEFDEDEAIEHVLVTTAVTPPESIPTSVPELPPAGEIAKLGINRPGVAPKRIGDGTLIPTRLTWKPGDPFASEAVTPTIARFRWELMLTAACVTAVSGMGFVWLLRSVFA